MKMNIKTARKGFTLIELLVVIAIIGVLASVVLASLNTARRKSRDTRRVADIKQIQLALEMSFDKGTASGQEYPNTVALIVADGFLPSEPKDPTTLLSYPYDNYADTARATCDTALGSCVYYHLGTLLEGDANVGPLTSDRDLELKFDNGPDGISTGAACASDPVATAVTDKCYDVTP